MENFEIFNSILVLDEETKMTRYFFKLFKSKAKGKVREGALTPDEVKKIINEIGKNKKVNITRLAYDGHPEDKPASVKIIDIRDDHFTGKIVNIERSIKQSEDDKLVYIKGGGGTIAKFLAVHNMDVIDSVRRS